MAWEGGCLLTIQLACGERPVHGLGKEWLLSIESAVPGIAGCLQRVLGPRIYRECSVEVGGLGIGADYWDNLALCLLTLLFPECDHVWKDDGCTCVCV